MNIILDTNILRQDFLLKSNKFEALFSYLLKTGSTLIIPDIVIKESINLYKNEVVNLFSNLKMNLNKFNHISSNNLNIDLSIDIEAEVENYKKLLKTPRSFAKSLILPIDPNHLEETVDRLIEKRKPATEKSHEFRDIIIWLSIKEYLRQNNDEKTAFISLNTNEFCESSSNSKLHTMLYEELKKENLDLIYSTSIESFLKEHQSKIDFITKEWIITNIPNDLHNIALKEISSRENKFERHVARAFDNVYNYFSVNEIELTLEEFFVYDMRNDGIYLHLSYFGEVDIEVEIIESYYTNDSFYKYVYPEIYLNFSAKIIENEITDIELDNWDLY